MDDLINSIEVYVESEELRKLGLTEEEILGYFDFFYSSWLKDNLKLRLERCD